MTEHAWSRQEFEQKLREKGAYYHIHHPFHKRMNEGHCSVDEIQGWVANRLYYQMAIPVKDAAILANCEDQSVRRTWIQRIIESRVSQRPLRGLQTFLTQCFRRCTGDFSSWG